MPSRRVKKLIERLEADPEHGLTPEAWERLLILWSEEYHPRSEPPPAVFASWQERLKVYRWRWAHGYKLVAQGDTESGPMGEMKVDRPGMRVRLRELILKVRRVNL